MSQLKKQKPEAVGSGGAVQALRMENDAPVVGPDAPTANSKMVKLDIATADWSRPTSGLRVNHFRLRVDMIIPVSADLLKLRDFASRYTAAWCSQNPASVAAFYSENGSLRVNDDPPAVGRDAITQVAQSFMSAFPDLCVVMDDLRLRDEPEYHWTLFGTNSGAGGTGRSVRISGFEKWRIGADGLIASSQGHFDAAEYRRQLEHGV